MKAAVVSKTPWGIPVAVPYHGAWKSLPALGRAVYGEATHRGLALTDRQINAMLDSLQLVDDLSQVVQ